jgi:hypothetical protein
LAKGDDQYAVLLVPLPLPLMLSWCFVWIISEIRSFRIGSKVPLPITGAPIAVAVTGENIVAAGNTENEFVAVVVVVVVPAVPDPSCFILLAGGGTSRVSSW